MTTTETTTHQATIDQAADVQVTTPLSPAVVWLETTATITANLRHAAETWQCWNAPMFTFKDDDETCPPAVVDARDYADPMRWWL